jgi:small subunit ribosomal protein S16
MATKIRLQRHGRKGRPIYHIVIADSRAKRDGRFIEKLGVYNPNTQPATMDINHDRALHWVQVGAVPTDTVRAILSYTGVLMKKHLLDGAKKGAFSEEEALKRFDKWMEGKEGKIASHVDSLAKAKADAAAKALAQEKEVRAKMEEAIAAKNTPEVEETEEVAEEAATEETATEESTEA